MYGAEYCLEAAIVQWRVEEINSRRLHFDCNYNSDILPNHQLANLTAAR